MTSSFLSAAALANAEVALGGKSPVEAEAETLVRRGESLLLEEATGVGGESPVVAKAGTLVRRCELLEEAPSLVRRQAFKRIQNNTGKCIRSD